jgi:pyruvate,water dikinase
MRLIYSPDDALSGEAGLSAVLGGKASALFKLYRTVGMTPRLWCISTAGYDLFVRDNDLRAKINLELYRKDLKDMRWEEIWDISLRIQGLFLKAKISKELQEELSHLVLGELSGQPLSIRSSAPSEDGAELSYAGLHDSFLNITGIDDITRKIKRVWASLWSDRAILYRQELGLDARSSSMAVILQEFIAGKASGILFTSSPTGGKRMELEAVHGLNQGLVDGEIEPDRWGITTDASAILDYRTPKERQKLFAPSPATGVILQESNPDQIFNAPLADHEVLRIASAGTKLEQQFGCPQDIEWTLAAEQLFILQSRPITTISAPEAADKRAWYLSLTRSYDNLLHLWQQVEEVLLPQMAEEASRLAAMDLHPLTDEELANQLRQRHQINEHWSAVYWAEFIPFAHGVRLFGQLYNDVMEPANPFDFVSLLVGQEMLSTRRNTLLHSCAQIAASDEGVAKRLREGEIKAIDHRLFQENMSSLKQQFSMAGLGDGDDQETDALLIAIILQYTEREANGEATGPDRQQLEADFLEKAEGRLPCSAKDLLAMARASYRLRDDDNIYLGRIAQELDRAVGQARERVFAGASKPRPKTSVEELIALLCGEQLDLPLATTKRDFSITPKRIRARQLQGQAASVGIARGKARVIEDKSQLKEFVRGEVLIIDAVDPTLTFFAPLARGIVERRGGMLIHGAIIAREYGIPCITGVDRVTSLVKTGDTVTVDGYLGICTIEHAEALV